MLEIKGLTKNFGGLTAINDVDITVKKGDILGLIGPNGAGKTTLFNLITGFLRPTEGSLIFEKKEITGKSTHSIAKLGIVRTFQANNICPAFTVLENVSLAKHLTPRINMFETVFRTPASSRKERMILEQCSTILDLVGMSTMAGVQAKVLSQGHKRLLGIAIALAADPKILLLDEPLGGMNSSEVDETIKVINRLWEGGITIVIIEHNMRAAMSLCKRIAVLNFGKKIAEGSPAEMKSNRNVIQAYLGTH
ncbi:MAG: ABC transporter ATP-binding protein [Deltaproteobacteria bacterium]|nr:ABC transporter ATP-binding protein [Deltaproteobacteria bacterium]